MWAVRFSRTWLINNMYICISFCTIIFIFSIFLHTASATRYSKKIYFSQKIRTFIYKERELSDFVQLKIHCSVIFLLMHNRSIRCNSQVLTKKLRKFSVYYIYILSFQCFLSSVRDARHVGYYGENVASSNFIFRTFF